MLYVKDEMFYVFIEHSKSMLNVECSVYIKGKRLTFTQLSAHLIVKKSKVKYRFPLLDEMSSGHFSKNYKQRYLIVYKF